MSQLAHQNQVMMLSITSVSIITQKIWVKMYAKIILSVLTIATYETEIKLL